MMNIDQPIGTYFVLDDGRVVMLMGHEYDGRVRLWVSLWPKGWASKANSSHRQHTIYMTPRAFARRAKLYEPAPADREETP